MPRFMIDRCGLILLIAVLALPTAAQADEGEVLRLTAENQQLREQIDALTAELDALRQTLAALQQDHVELTEETEQLEKQAARQQVPPAPFIQDRAMAIQADRVRGKYDQDGDRTVVTFGPEELEVESNPGTFYFSVVFSHDGREPAAVDQATLYLQTFRAGRLFHQQETAEFQVDGEPELIAITGYDLKARKTGAAGRTRTDRSDEVVEFKLDRAALARLGDAKRLTVDLGRGLVRFDQDDLAALRAVAQRMSGQ